MLYEFIDLNPDVIMQSEDRHIRFTVEPVDPALSIDADPQLLASHGGEIHIRNMPGKGCVFVIDVPLAGEASVPQAVVQP